MSQIKDEIKKIIREFVSQEILEDEKNHDRTLNDLGVDSLDRMTVFLNVQEKFSLAEIQDAQIEQLKTINDIERYVKNEAGQKKAN